MITEYIPFELNFWKTSMKEEPNSENRIIKARKFP